MINTSDFIKRLQKVIDFHNETSSSFAEKVGVQRSSISHILSGRNKPSLDFVMKVLESYPNVELYWLMNGKGIFPNDAEKISKSKKTKTKPPLKVKSHNANLDIEKIVIFYKNGTFKSYKP